MILCSGSVGNRNRLNQEDKTMALFEGAGER